MDCGMPCSLKMLSRKSLAKEDVVYKCARGTKCAYLLNLSMKAMITLLPLDVGSPSMKSMLMSTQNWLGMGNGWSNLIGWRVSILLC